MSKKLTGNGLWESSRMLLPQHKEQALMMERGMPRQSAIPPSAEEIEMIRESVVLPMVLEIVLKKVKEVEGSNQTLKHLYSAATKVVAKHIRQDIQHCRKSLLDHQIRIQDCVKEHSEVVYNYSCRGAEGRMTITKDYLREDIGFKIGKYTRSLVAIIHQEGKQQIN
ncbi:hypothetical protein YDYSY3_39140 [Paenibacillus chitinolyticus]|uniref:hypothetical protein n=1 Tax=Paenibacillus chitinolyticus TaxID=79263 RepID=UPI0026E4D0F8|nr:hypothetical protein [Paenibacillus chitinolyticus]GKS12914.1 hypothetical protein YDYSY3_39140 [Paenibacillus chitinolyticus]